MNFNKIGEYSLLLLLVILTSCSNRKPESATDQSMVNVSTDTVALEDSTSSAEVNEKIVQKKLKSGDYGVVKGLVTYVDIAEVGPSFIYVNVNGNPMEIVDWTGVDGYAGIHDSLVGKEVVVKYLYKEFFEEVDIHINDTSVRAYNDFVTEEDKSKYINSKRVDGVISWNGRGVSGDSPSKYGITKADGSEVVVVGWVYEDLFLEIDGKQATVYYTHESGRYATLIRSPQNKKDTQSEIDFIKEKFSTITSKMDVGEYANTEFEVEGIGVVAQYKRAMDGDELRFMSLAYCSDHGCDKTSYYFWDKQVILEFVENSYWVGNTDEIFEKRNYYYDLEQVRSIEREISGPGGYDKVKKQLASKVQRTLPLGQPFDMDKITTYFDISKEQAQRNTFIFFPDNN